MTPTPLDLSQPQRQSPLAVVFLAIRTLRQIGIAQLVIAVVFLSRLGTAAIFVVAPLIGLGVLGFGAIAWWRFTFRLEDGEIRVTRGVLSEDRLSVPLERIQSVSLDQQFLHRILGLVQVSLDTAGTSEAEFTIDAVNREVADALARVAAERRRTSAPPASEGDDLDAPVPPPPPTPERVLLRRDVARLLKAGIARPAFAGLAVVFPFLAVADDLASTFGLALPDVDGPDPALWMLWLLPALLAAAIAAGLLLNLVQIVLSEWDLVLVERDRGFRREAGLISRTATSTNIDRVQWLATAENPIERRLGIQRVSLPTLGEGDLHLPGTDQDELAMIRDLVLEPDARVDALDRGVSPAEVFLATRNTGIVAVLAAVGLWFVIGWWSLLALLLVPWEFLQTRREVRLFRWGVAEGGIARQKQFLSIDRRDLVVRKINGVTVRQRLFERSRELGTVAIHTANGTITIGMLPLDEARELRDLLLARVETDERPWM
ncbi:MAG: PH domain-containing protein [Actinomycetota bacterium]